jgi:hypothetical protein
MANWKSVDAGGGQDPAQKRAALVGRLETARANRKAAAEELTAFRNGYVSDALHEPGEGAVDDFELANEVRQYDELIRELNVAIFVAEGKIKKMIGGQKCPTCTRKFDEDMILSPELLSRLEAAVKSGGV